MSKDEGARTRAPSRRDLLLGGLAAAAAALPGAAHAAIAIDANIPYRAPESGIPSERFTLDIYRDGKDGGERRPIVLYFHGGGFDRGGKEAGAPKAQAFVDAGYVFVAANRRHAVMPGPGDANSDSAEAIAWLLAHASTYGANPGRLFLMGHSAGAALAALLATDESYLGAVGLGLSSLRGVVCVDTAGYDKATQAERAPDSTAVRMYRELGLSDADLLRQSPLAHVAPGKGIPPFLLYHRTPRTDGQSPTERFAAALREAGVEAEIALAADRTHATIDSRIGEPGDAVTQTIVRFIARHANPS